MKFHFADEFEGWNLLLCQHCGCFCPWRCSWRANRWVRPSSKWTESAPSGKTSTTPGRWSERAEETAERRLAAKSKARRWPRPTTAARCAGRDPRDVIRAPSEAARKATHLGGSWVRTEVNSVAGSAPQATEYPHPPPENTRSPVGRPEGTRAPPPN